MDIWGRIKINGNNLDMDDELAAFDASGLTIAVFVQNKEENSEDADVYILSLSQDDPLTPEDEGFFTGNDVIFKLYDKSEDYAFQIDNAMLTSHSEMLGGQMFVYPATFTGNGNLMFQTNSMGFFYGLHFDITYTPPELKIESVSPESSLTIGGELLTITGTRFKENLTIQIGENESQSITVVSSTKVTCLIPPSDNAGIVSIIVTNSDGVSFTKNNAFQYLLPPPQIDSIDPNEAYLSGGTPITITGQYFDTNLTLKVDNETVAPTEVSTNLIKFDAPPRPTPGQVSIVVSNSESSSTTGTFAYLYDPPVITEISPAEGSINGLTVTIIGNYFRDGISVEVAGHSANTKYISTTTIQCFVPSYSAEDLVSVIVSNVNDETVAQSSFQYYIIPEIEAITPDTTITDGGDTLQITGNHFQDEVSVTIDGISITPVTRLSYTQITCIIPEHSEAGVVDVVVQNPNGKNASTQITYVTPTPIISLIEPENIYTSGGTLTINGTYFQSGLTITVDGIATSYTRNSTQMITCMAPPHEIGQVELILTNPDGKFIAYTLNYVYHPPIISQITPQSGSTEGVEIMTITGNYFRQGAVVTVAENTANVQSITTTTIVCDIPAYTKNEAVDIVVMNSDGKNYTFEKAFTYVVYPKIQSINPVETYTTGGETLQITGENFQIGVSVSIDSIAITPVNRLSYTQITCIIPGHSAGNVDITVKNQDNGYATFPIKYVAPPPSITEIDPEEVFLSGGDPLTIRGTNFQVGLTNVTIDGRLASNVTRITESLVICNVPSSSNIGPALLMLINPDGQSTTCTINYKYDPPVITDITPDIVSAEGNEILTISGYYFYTMNATVRINSLTATMLSITPNTIQCTIPEYTDNNCTDKDVDVVVLNFYGEDKEEDVLKYVFIPKISSLDPKSSETTGGGKLSIFGSNFQNEANVLIDTSVPDNISVVSHTQITCDIPAHDVGLANVIVINPNTYSATTTLKYELPAPAIVSILPSTVVNSGGTALTIIGTNFDISATVTINGVTVANNHISYSKMTCIAPSHVITPEDNGKSPVELVVINPNGQSDNDSLTYVFNQPVINNISPATGTSESLTFTIFGEYFRDEAEVVVGGINCTIIMLTSDSILCNATGFNEAGNEVEISVKNIFDDNPVIKTDIIKFLPSIKNVTPQIVYTTSVSEGVPITITGAHFEPGLTVTMAGSIITDLTNTETTIRFNAPSFNGYTKTDITVINPDNLAATKENAFEYRDVKASFKVSPDSMGNVPYRVLFEDTSLGKITNIKKWIWQYADGQTQTTTTKTFAYQYNNVGTYQVKMCLVVLSNGHTYTETASIQTVEVLKQDIDLEFKTIGGQVGHPPFTVELDNQTTHADNLNITWTWDFGDGNTSNVESPRHTYTQVGKYTIILQAEFNDEMKSITKTDYITVIAPKPDNRITGRVHFDNDNQLPDNTWVHVWSPETGEGASVPVDENGYYTVVDLDPDGEYIISVDFKFGQAYYNDTTVFSNSQAASVTPSDGYNITLPSQFYSASGKLIFENGQPVSNIMIEAFSEETGYWSFAISSSRFNDNANYKLNELISGTYTIRVISEKYTLKGDGSPITIVVNDVNHSVIIPDLILQREARSISGTISGVDNKTKIWISAFSQSVDFAKAISITVAGSIQYTLNDLKPAVDYVVQLHAQDYPDIYYDSRSGWFEADWVNTLTSNAEKIDFTLTSYNRSISGLITVPDNAQSGDIVWIDAFSDSLQINSAAMITVDEQCTDIGDCDYPYTISGLLPGDDYIVVVNSDIYETLFYDNQQSMRDAEPVNLNEESKAGINFEMAEGNYIDGSIIKPDDVEFSDIEVEAWSNETNSWGYAIPDENGNFAIDGLSQASDFIVQAFIEDEPPYIFKDGAIHTRDIADATKVASVQGGSTSIIIELVTGLKISGLVKNSTGENLANVMVMVDNQSENIHIISRTNSYGTYSIMGLPGNLSYSITADPGVTSSLIPKTKTIQAYDFTQDSSINLALSSGWCVSGTVTYEGANINGADVFLRSPVSGYDRWSLTTKSGKFVFNGVPGDTVNDYELVVETDLNYERVIKEIPVTSDVSLDITLTQAAGYISGIVVNNKNEPLPDVLLQVYSVEKEFQRFDILTNYKGEYEVNGLPYANDYVVTAIPDTYTYANETRTGIAPPDTQNFTLIEGGRISGTVGTSDGSTPNGTLVVLNSATLNVSNEMTRTDSDGNYSFDALLSSDANDYIVSVYPIDYPEPAPLTGLNIGKSDANFTLTKGNDTKISGILHNTGGVQIKLNVYNNTTFRIEGQVFVSSDGTFEINSLEAGIEYVLHFVSKDGSINRFYANGNSLSEDYNDILTVFTGAVLDISL
jgi:PKD repeat protein